MKKALVIVSFGTTYERARRSIDAVERALAQAAEGYDVFRAYTSSIVRKVLKSRGEIVPSLEEALEKLANESYDTVFVQPTHLLCGNEYDEKIRASYMRYAGRFLRGGIGKPLIANNDDLLKLAEILAALKPDDADALLLMGHGTTHFANMVYPAIQTALRLQGHPNVVVGTVEGWPTLENAIDELRALGAKHIELRPMMLVAGDHAQNDMAGDDADSWKSHLTAAGFDVHCTVEGLGELEDVQRLYNEWCMLQRKIYGIYTDKDVEFAPLWENKEFKKLKNAIVSEAEKLGDSRIFIDEETENKEPESDENGEYKETATDNPKADTDSRAKNINPTVISSAANLFCRLASIIENDTERKTEGFYKTIVDSKERKHIIRKKQSLGMKMR